MKDQLRQQFWEGEVREEEISYLKEMITSQGSVFSMLGALSLGAILSIPLGLGIGAIPLIAWAAGESIAALFIPSSPVFRDKINRRKRRDAREKARDHLLEEIESRTKTNTGGHWATYGRMQDRISSLKTIASSRKTAISDRDVERLDDAAVNYLGMWLAWLVMAERWEGTDEKALNRRIEAIDKQIEDAAKAMNRKRLEKARSDLQAILDRRKGLWGRATALEAAMLHMADTFEEIYQRAITNPNSMDVAKQLGEAVEKMALEEELDFALEEELGGVLSRRKLKA